MAELKKILIIDDDTRNIFALKAVLKSRGYDCISSGGAPEGIDILKHDPGIKVVLLDMMMPEMDGYEAIGIIRNDEQISHLKIVAVTAQAMLGDREKCLDAGADAYISKPVDLDILEKILKEQLSDD